MVTLLITHYIENDKILIYSANDTNTKMPTMTNFLSAITGTGLTSE